MILVYAINTRDAGQLQVIPLMAEVKLGRPLGRTVYPAQADELLKVPPPNLSLEKSDRRILMQLVMHQGTDGQEIFFSGKAAAMVVKDLIATGRCYLWDHRDAPLAMVDAIEALPVWREANDCVRPFFDFPYRVDLLPCMPPYAVHRGSLGVARVISGIPDDAATFWARGGEMSAEEAVRFTDRMLREYPDAAIPSPPQLERSEIEDLQPTPCVRVRLEEGEDSTLNPASIVLSLTFDYGGKEIQPSDDVDRVRYMADGKMLDVKRQIEHELRAIERLESAGFLRVSQPVEDLFAAASQRDCWALGLKGDWFDIRTKLWPLLEGEGWRFESLLGEFVVVDESCWYSDMVQSGRGWFSFEAGIRLGDRKVNILPIIKDYLARHGAELDEIRDQLTSRHLPVLTDNGVALVPGERIFYILRHLFELFSGKALNKDDTLKLDVWRAAEVAELESISEQPWDAPRSLRKLAESMRGGLEIGEAREVEHFGTELRPYQRLGLGWLRFLRDHKLGGILADDMGLGKTVQIIALLAEDHAAENLDLPALVVAPTSLMLNWRSELKRFAPQLKVVVMHGSDRFDREDELQGADVIVTTYTLMRNDDELYRNMRFSYLILDEAQAIKNPDTRSAKMACSLRGNVRFCLTGTPVENHLSDLWSLFNFALPGFLGGRRAFRSQFQLPIEESAHPVLSRILRRRVRPFLLRRTKDKVAPELPKKSEIIQRVSLSQVQHDQYQSVRMAMADRIKSTLQEKGFARSQITILDALVKLREVCCDPRLREPEREFEMPADSAKMAALEEMLPEMISEGRRVLLFSQFTRMLSLIEKLLHRLDIPYVTLTGSTRDRETPIKQFCEGDVPLFLISLKAGGVGLNLAAADTVIHYDPWWNPAVESQATDRAHRIGQDKPVFVYKLIAEGTIEDRILEMHERKRGLVENLVSNDGVKGSMSIQQEDIDLLLGPIGEGI